MLEDIEIREREGAVTVTAMMRDLREEDEYNVSIDVTPRSICVRVGVKRFYVELPVAVDIERARYGTLSNGVFDIVLPKPVVVSE